MKRLMMVALLGLSACSTVQARREDPPIFVGSTSNSLAQFQGCFARQVEREVTPTYTPRENGGSYAQTVNSYVMWVVDIEDLGSERRATVYAPDTVSGPNQRIIGKVQACL